MLEDDSGVAVSNVQIASVCSSADVGTRVGAHCQLLAVGGRGGCHSGRGFGTWTDTTTTVLNRALLRYLGSAAD